MLIFSSPCRRPLRLLRYELFTNCKKFLETIMLASKWTRLFGSFYRKQEQRNIWKGCPVFPDRMVQAELHEKLSLIPVSGFRGRFSINGTDLYTMVNAILGRNWVWIECEPASHASHASHGSEPCEPSENLSTRTMKPYRFQNAQSVSNTFLNLNLLDRCLAWNHASLIQRDTACVDLPSAN